VPEWFAWLISYAKGMAPKTAARPVTNSAPLPEVASRLRLAVMRLSRRLRQHAPGGVTPSQLSALSTIVAEGRVTLSQLAVAERVQPPSITRVVDILVTEGFATRTQSEEDRRVAWVEPTPTGRDLVDAVRRQRDAYLAQRLSTLSREDVAVLARAAALLEELTADLP
jgi:DNA-binding MarR family transcriptional regulator